MAGARDVSRRARLSCTTLPAQAPAANVDARDERRQPEKEPPEDCVAAPARPGGGPCVSSAAGTRAWPKVAPGLGPPPPGPMMEPGGEGPPCAAVLPCWRARGRKAVAKPLHRAGWSRMGAKRRTSGRRLSDARWQSDPAARAARALWARHCPQRRSNHRLLPENLVFGLLQRWLFRASTPNAGSLWEPAPTVWRARCITSGGDACCLAAPHPPCHARPHLKGKLRKINYLRRKRGAKDYRGNARV